MYQAPSKNFIVFYFSHSFVSVAVGTDPVLKGACTCKFILFETDLCVQIAKIQCHFQFYSSSSSFFYVARINVVNM